MASPGNHEIVFNFTSFNNRFYLPYKFSNALDSTYYSYNHGYAHYIALNTDIGVLEDFNFPGITQKQVEWLENDLINAVANRKQYPWIVVYVHRPLYCSQNDSSEAPFFACTSEAKYIRDNFEDLFFNYKVDFVMTAHKHSYERLYPVYKGKIISQSYDNPEYPVYVVNGAAGNREMHSGNFLPNPPEWSAYRNGENFGYAILTIYNTTTLQYSYYDSEKDVLLDQFIINK